MDELIILFLYHGGNLPVAVDHYHRLRTLHPRDLVVPIAFQLASQVIPGTADIAHDSHDYDWPLTDVYAQADKVFYRWFLNPRNPKARRYIFFEYDILPKCPAQESYREVWDADVAASDVVDMIAEPDWWPARWGPPIEPDLLPYQIGLRPLAGAFWSHAALERVASSRRMQGAWCEHRAGTLAKFFGFRPMRIPGAIRTIHWPPTVLRDFSGREWFHPVKTMQPRTQRIRPSMRGVTSTSP